MPLRSLSGFFTYNRWLAQGRQVQRGEHGEGLVTWIEKKDTDGEVTGTFPRSTTVFCRCQTQPVAELQAAA